MITVNYDKFKIYLEDYEKSFKGWDFSYIESTHRAQEQPLNWSYRSIVLNYLLYASNLLDIGTGGGEFLSSLFPLPKNTIATESYKPNIQQAKSKLCPLGVDVVEINNSGKLPLKNNFFDLIINRHGFYDPDEVNRILKKNCCFITQQVGDQNAKELNLWFNSKIDNNQWDLKKASKDLLKSNFSLVGEKEIKTKTRFYDVGAILYFLKAISWQIPDFTLEKYLINIKKLHNQIESNGYFDVTCHRFLIIAKKT
ncbi:MAG TPA: methyltransferase domain-containing protein [Caldisericia bacterium]|nr:methyltransferase domain-containing protein [Caldisericia bacterium]